MRRWYISSRFSALSATQALGMVRSLSSLQLRGIIVSPQLISSLLNLCQLTVTLVRAFPGPGAGDQKGNPLPGCLIERDVTTPFEWDFYLYSHTALQGTARPVHYTILRDDANHEPNRIQNMIYEHCYQYMRSTTSVSMFPAVYYAHLGEYLLCV